VLKNMFFARLRNHCAEGCRSFDRAAVAMRARLPRTNDPRDTLPRRVIVWCG